jgi:predicted 3-demethylubiquinone-9 3-methyltransferase (glyoxalase superfamily)
MKKISPALWFDGNAEEAAEFYTEIFPDSQIDRVIRSPADNPSTKKHEVLVVEFTLLGQPFIGINGGPMFRFSEAISFDIDCEDQDEVDHYWKILTAKGGEPGMCGWCKDRFGVSWQVTPKRLRQMLISEDREAAERAMQAMMAMGKIDIDTLETAYKGSDANGRRETA